MADRYVLRLNLNEYAGFHKDAFDTYECYIPESLKDSILAAVHDDVPFPQYASDRRRVDLYSGQDIDSVLKEILDLVMVEPVNQDVKKKMGEVLALFRDSDEGKRFEDYCKGRNKVIETSYPELYIYSYQTRE